MSVDDILAEFYAQEAEESAAAAAPQRAQEPEKKRRGGKHTNKKEHVSMPKKKKGKRGAAAPVPMTEERETPQMSVAPGEEDFSPEPKREEPPVPEVLPDFEFPPLREREEPAFELPEIDESLSYSVDEVLSGFYAEQNGSAAEMAPIAEEKESIYEKPAPAPAEEKAEEDEEELEDRRPSSRRRFESRRDEAEEPHGKRGKKTGKKHRRHEREEDLAPNEPMPSDDEVFDSLRTESAPAAAPAASAAAVATAERRSAMPSQQDVDELIAALRGGEFLDLHEHEVSEPEVEFDERYLIGGKRRARGYVYGDASVDTAAEENYVPPTSENAIPTYARETDGEEDEDLPDEAAPLLRGRLTGFFGKKKQKNNAAKTAADEDTASEAAALSARDYAEEPQGSDESVYDEKDAEPLDDHRAAERDDEEKLEEGFYPHSFKEYIYSMITALLYRMRSGKGAYTAYEDDEDLGAEVSCAKASKYYGKFIRSMRLRLHITLVILFAMAWISLGLPVSGQFRTAAGACAAMLGMQLTIMLLCLDVVTSGIMNAVRGKFGAEGMAVLGCIITSFDALLTAKAGLGGPHTALCFLSSLSLVGMMFAAVLHARSMRKALRVPAIGKSSYAVTGETSEKGDVTILKSVRPAAGFVRRSEQASMDEELFYKLSLPLLAVCFVLALIIVGVKKNVSAFLYVFSALWCVSVPFASLCCFSLPFFIGSMRIFPSGAAIAGWSGMSDIGQSKNLIVTDRDLFPDGTVEIGQIRIFADRDPNEIISYAGSMMAAAGSCSAACFGELMERNDCRMRQIENFEFLAGGGMKGVIDSRVILCGSTDLMRLMNVRIPYRLVDKTSVLLAVDGVLCGIFNLRYTAKPQVRGALIDLMRSNRHGVFAIRDFNVTPEMLHNAFDVATDGYDFPPYIERFAMSAAEPGEDSQIAAVLCREGLGPLVDTADTARSMYTATRLNTYLTVFSAVLGILIVTVKFLHAGAVSIGFLFLFMLLFALLVGAISFFTNN